MIKQWIEDFFTVWSEKLSVITRRDKYGGSYFWAKGEAKEIMRQIKPQIAGRYQWARFGGIYIRDQHVARQVYEAFSQQAGLCIVNVVGLGRVIDT